MGKHKQVVAKEDMDTLPPDLIPNEKAKGSPSSTVKIDADHCAVLTHRAEQEFYRQLDKQLKAFRGQHCSADDTLRIKIAFEVCYECREGV